jgi:hypothetical protein
MGLTLSCTTIMLLKKSGVDVSILKSLLEMQLQITITLLKNLVLMSQFQILANVTSS